MFAEPQTATNYYDLLDLNSEQCIAKIEGLPAGSGQFVGIRSFDGWAISSSPDHGASYLKGVGAVIDRAHARGYKVIAFLPVLRWSTPNLGTRPPDVLEYATLPTYPAEKTEFASPLDPFVQATVLTYCNQFFTDDKADLTVLDYRLPRSPIFAYGTSSRLGFINARSVDPIDLPQTANLETGDRPNKDFLSYMTWRLTASNEFLSKILAAMGPEQAVGKRAIIADPLWANRSAIEKGSKLDDWVYAVAKHPGLDLFYEGQVASQDSMVGIAGLRNTATELQIKPIVWVISSLETEFDGSTLSFKKLRPAPAGR